MTTADEELWADNFRGAVWSGLVVLGRCMHLGSKDSSVRAVLARHHGEAYVLTAHGLQLHSLGPEACSMGPKTGLPLLL